MRCYLQFKKPWQFHVPLKLLLKTFLLVLFTAVQVHGHAQNVTISEHNVPLEKLLMDLKEQSGYNFLYNSPMLASARRVSISVTNSPIDEVLRLCFKDQPLDYTIRQKTIIIRQKDKPVTPPAPPADITISGRVTNDANEALPGVSIGIKGSGRGTTSDANGNFVLHVRSENDTLLFTFIGFAPKEVVVGNRTRIDIKLTAENKSLGEIVVVGYGQQTKATVTGAVAAIKSADIVRTKNENVTNMLTGKLAGVRIVQKSSEPGTFNNSFDIRGMGDALIIIDGIPRDNMARLNPDDVESISVLKDASAAVYGVRAANGVVLITTKKGKAGTNVINYSANFGIQTPIGSPKSTSAADWMTLANEKSMHNQNGGTLRYSLDEVAAYKNGTKQGTDWYKAVIRPSAPMSQHNLSTSGGSDRVQYYASLGYLSQESFLRSNSNSYKRYNLRSNVTGRITDRLKADFQLNGVFDESNKNYESTDWIIRSMERSAAIQPIYANNNPNYLQVGTVDGSNPVAMADANQSGYRKYGNKWFQSNVSLEYDVPGITGLRAKGMFGYDYQLLDNKIYKKQYNLYNYDDAAASYNATVNQSPSNIRREFYTKQSILTQFSLNYVRTFNEVHNLNILALVEGQHRQGDNIFAARDLSLLLDQLSAGNSVNQQGSMSTGSGDLYDYANIGYVGKANYNYKGKYLAEFNFRYDGSSRFDKSHRWGFFPSGSVGWRFTDEDFWKNLDVKFIDNAKFRASYGVLGDDNASTYQWLNGYTYPAGGDYNNLPGGSVFNGSYVNSAVSTGIANKNITWYTAKTFDVGLDLTSKNGMFGLIVDYFQRKRSGLLTTRTVSLPSVVGAALPQENLNGDMTRGIDIEITHHYKIGEVSYNVRGTFGFTRTQYTYQESGKYGNNYNEWRSNNNNRYSDMVWGFKGIGQFQSYDEIANSKVKYDQGTLPGDYKYEDTNGDGIINDLDLQPISYSNRPMFSFGLTMDASWKGFDVALLFQGAAKTYVNYVEILAEPIWGSNYSNALDQFMDRWHPVDPTANPYDPNTKWVKGKYAYTGSVARGNSTFSWLNASYLRLKTVELGYTLPVSLLKRVGIKGARVYANVYNAHTWSSMKFIDPEHPSDSYGNVYPLNRTYNMGFTINL
ncbi:TonB-dependent receptor [Chitinophaga sancti]|uniref:TonB-dependent receptor n=1 Tax=Chitinophaga sancti TaxID=1004 RepID=A0A1K1R6H0_9BACT|nr:TonB-dependent receptor [Chitinophaga sancti]WQD64192.1 TonB-dependent receptor [Chitinophaga sancti]WQG90184.1 TonB-dependent receptor [Chitinophaga sancti]SFW67605.1 TonB-linked outer membrane protein, SusC/RagA family [Chitinophaga sancti]